MRSQGEKESFTQPRYHRYWGLTWGLDALCTLLRELPRNLPASIFVVMQVGGARALGSILNRCGAMPVVEAREGEKIERGRAYVAPWDRHLLLNNGQISLSRGPRENRHRPAIDPLLLERALWIAVRSLDERIAIHEALAQQQREVENTLLAERLAETASSASHDVKLIREILDRL
jgi:hypothetical protein